MYQEGTEANQKYEEGTFADHSKVKAKQAAASIKAGGMDLFSKAKGFYNKKKEESAQQQNQQPQNNNYNYNNYDD